MSARVKARARSHEDRGGDPLDGLVNLFDLGIVLAVAFLLAALSSLNLSPSVLQGRATQQQTVPRDSVVTRPDEQVEQMQVEAGDSVVGRGEKLGEVYKLSDGRTVIVKPRGASAATSR